MGVTLFTDSIDVTHSTSGAWTDVDCSAHIPAGATGVILEIVRAGGPGQTWGFRKNGSSDARTETMYASGHGWGAIGVDGSRIFELYLQDHTNYTVYLWGYFTSEAYFHTNAPDFSLGVTGAWTDIDISGQTPDGDAMAAIFEVHCTYALGQRQFGFRKNGSGDAPYYWLYRKSCPSAFVGCDGSEICEGAINATDVDFYLSGYLKDTAAADFYTNMVDDSLGGTGAYADITVAGAIAAIWNVYDTNVATSTMNIREKGCVQDHYYAIGFNAYIFTGLDGDAKAEGKIATTFCDFLRVAEFTESGTTSDLDENLPMLTISATHVQTGTHVLAEFPMLTMSSTALTGGIHTVDETLPIFTIEASYPPGVDVDVELPMFELDSQLEAVNTMTVDIEYDWPDMILTSTLLTGEVFTVDIELPMFDIEAVWGDNIEAEFPMPTLSSTLLVGQVMNGVLTLPRLAIVASHVQTESREVEVSLPKLRLASTAITSALVTGAGTFPMLTASSYVYVGQVATVDVEFPIFNITTGSQAGIEYGVDVTLPMMTLEAFLQSAVAGNFEVLAFNIRRKGVTTYTNYGFDSLTKFGNVYLGANSNGIYLLTGNQDQSTNIDSIVATGKSHYGVHVRKRIMDAYVGMTGTGDFYLTITTDDGVTKNYPLVGPGSVVSNTKCHTGRGIKGIYWQAGFKNVAGEDFKLDFMELLTKFSKRRK